MADITMPQLGETVTEGTITKWFKKVGEAVAEDEVLFEVSTDKVDSEVPSSAAGQLAEILVQEGETVDVGTRLAVISEGGAEAGDADADRPAGAEAGDADADRPAGAEAEARTARQAEPAREEPSSEMAEPSRKDASSEKAEPNGGERAGPSGGDDGDGDRGGATRQRVLSPVVRKMLSEHDLDVSQIEGTGRQGRVTRSDVLAHIEKAPSSGRGGDGRSGAASRTQDRPGAEAPAPRRDGEVEVVPFSNIRRRTAEHMVRSQATSAHVLVAIEVDFENVDRVRLASREQFKADEGFSLTYLPFVSRAVVDAVADFPHVNASVGDDQLMVHRHVHLGFAVDLGFEGLIVPVVHNADDKRLRTIARELSDLASRARARKLTADEISGSTFTITNPGSYGTLITAPVINQPQVAILSTDGVKKRPVVVELPDGTDAVAIHRVGNLAMSFDHRAFDGAYASAFVARVKDILETRDWAAEL